MQYFIDGSMLKLSNGYRGIGWAVKEAADSGKEYSGFFFTRNERLSCELVALVMLVSKLPKETWGDTSVYTDSEEVRQPLAFLVTDLNRSGYKEAFSLQLNWAVREVKKAYEGLAISVEDVLDFLKTVRLNKLKSHRGFIDNDRVDYLARNDLYAYLMHSPFSCSLLKRPIRGVRTTMSYKDWLRTRAHAFKHLY